MLIRRDDDGVISSDDIGFRREYFDCVCGSIDHTVAITYFLSLEDPTYIEEEVYLETQLHIEPSFWKRLYKACRYVLGWEYKNALWGECLIRPNDAKRMRKVLDKLIDSPYTNTD